MLKKSWLQKGSELTLVEGDFDVVTRIKTGIYNITRDVHGVFHLERFQDRFEFPFKIYGLQTDFIQYILKTYQNTNSNLGILMNGIKGAGKTVCAKVLCNELNLPVIIIKGWGQSNQEMMEFLGSFNFDCILFFDEFEKQFKAEDSTVLQIMDGVYNSTESRKIFLLTTNQLEVNDNLISRPSRIRYIKSFNDLDKDTVKEYLMDTLEDKSHLENLLEFIDTLEVSTIDILKAIVQEVNIHGFEEFKKVKSWFNISISDYVYYTWMAYIDEESIEKSLKTAECSSLTKLFEREIRLKEQPFEDPKHNPMWELLSSEEKRDKLKKYTEETKTFLCCNRKTIHSEIKFSNLKVGDLWYGDEIIMIDHEKCIIITKDDGYINCFKVNNPEQKPSLWGEKTINSKLAFGYNL